MHGGANVVLYLDKTTHIYVCTNPHYLNLAVYLHILRYFRYCLSMRPHRCHRIRNAPERSTKLFSSKLPLKLSLMNGFTFYIQVLKYNTQIQIIQNELALHKLFSRTIIGI